METAAGEQEGLAHGGHGTEPERPRQIGVTAPGVSDDRPSDGLGGTVASPSRDGPGRGAATLVGESIGGATTSHDPPSQPLAETRQTPDPSPYEPLATDLHPITDATLTVRIIKSFEFRTQKSLVLKGLDLGGLRVGELMERCRREIKTAPGFKPYRNLQLDTMKLYTVAHGHKTTNLIINLDHDEWILSDHERTLAELGAQNETELSFFDRAAYDAFKANPEVKWD